MLPSSLASCTPPASPPPAVGPADVGAAVAGGAPFSLCPAVALPLSAPPVAAAGEPPRLDLKPVPAHLDATEVHWDPCDFFLFADIDLVGHRAAMDAASAGGELLVETVEGVGEPLPLPIEVPPLSAATVGSEDDGIEFLAGTPEVAAPLIGDLDEELLFMVSAAPAGLADQSWAALHGDCLSEFLAIAPPVGAWALQSALLPQFGGPPVDDPAAQWAAVSGGRPGPPPPPFVDADAAAAGVTGSAIAAPTPAPASHDLDVAASPVTPVLAGGDLPSCHRDCYRLRHRKEVDEPLLVAPTPQAAPVPSPAAESILPPANDVAAYALHTWCSTCLSGRWDEAAGEWRCCDHSSGDAIMELRGGGGPGPDDDVGEARRVGDEGEREVKEVADVFPPAAPAA